MLFSDFKVWGLRNIPTPPMMALTELFHAADETNVQAYQYHGILSRVHDGIIYVLVHK